MKIVASNKRARYDYDIAKTVLAGLVLAGHEVKSVKSGAISLKGSFVSFRGGEAWLTNAHITPYKHATGLKDYEPTQSRKILLHRRELNELQGLVQSGGMAVVPLSVGVERGLVKVELGAGRGKKQFDKRQQIKKHDMLRDADREVGQSK
ncbi:SsrA-binding protein SmpB [Candidatus Saccharibacteria bacterium]|nr:SsrA-binding protein SmpB [Candidatus Saccharibacteria bacterium]